MEFFMTISAVNSGIQSFLQAQQRLSTSAEQIASASISESGPQALVEPLIDLRVAEQQALASVKIIETEQRILGALLDATA
jgi:hypothetical protein